MNARFTCPICEKPVAPRRENPFFPFCSRRCRLVDLAKWLGEEYRVPGEPAEDEDLPPRDGGEGEGEGEPQR